MPFVTVTQMQDSLTPESLAPSGFVFLRSPSADQWSGLSRPV